MTAIFGGESVDQIGRLLTGMLFEILTIEPCVP